MHIEPGIVTGAKIVLSYATATASLGIVARSLVTSRMHDGGAPALLLRSIATTGLVFGFFEVLPHHPVGVSEVHLILGSTLFLIFGLLPSAIGLALGLLIQGMFFAPTDLPQYAMNLTTLLVPLFAVAAIARRVIPRTTAYKDLSYRQALALSTSYQGGIVAWVAFWALYGNGFSVETLAGIAMFGGAYLTVIVVEPLIDLAVLAGAKAIHGARDIGLVQQRVHAAPT
jgi:ABC-type Co2+ transport system permease subunit